MGEAADMKVRLLIREGADLTYRQEIRLQDLSAPALLLLARIEPRIQEREYYDLPLAERVIALQARTMLDVAGAPHAMVQPHPDHILLPELTSRDRRFAVVCYGHPRHYETYVKWLDGCARTIDAARQARRAKLEIVNAKLDSRIDAWLQDLAEKDPETLIEPHDELVWRMDWERARISIGPSENEALKKRLRERVLDSGCETVREYLMGIPECHRFAVAADRIAVPAAAMAL